MGDASSRLTGERWQRIERLFEGAAALPEAERGVWLSAQCAGDALLQREVERMLVADAAAEGPLSRPAAVGLIGAWGGDAPPTRIGRWRLLERISEGGMGVVFRARRDDGAYEGEAAVKLISGPLSRDAVRRFERERHTLARLSHAGIARLLDGGTTAEGLPYLVMELVDGEPIDAFCDRLRIGLAGRVRLVLRVCQAVEHAHRCLIIHRDLKPANLLVTERGDPVLVDFGIAQVLADHGAGGAASSTAVPAFTAGYASPEQQAGEALSTAVDVYALGGVLHSLLTGETAEASGAGAPSAAALRAGDAAAARRGESTAAALAQRLRGDLDAVVGMAMAGDVARRYGSVAELAVDLERWLTALPVRARPVSGLRRAALFVRRHRVPVAAAGAVLASLLVGMGLSLYWAAEARRERNHAGSEAESAQVMVEFLMDTFLRAESLTDDRVVEIGAEVGRFADSVRRRFETVPHVRANLLDGLGGVQLALHHQPAALALIEEAAATRRALYGERSLEYALSLSRLGQYHYAVGEHDRALRVLAESYELQRALPRGAHSDLGRAANDLAVAHRVVGDRDGALRLHEEALQLRRDSVPGGLPVAESLNNLGVLHLGAGAGEAAQPLLAEALAIRERLLGSGHERTLQTTANLAACAQQRGDLERAAELLERVESGLRALGRRGSEGLARTLANLAVLDVHGERHAAAVDRLRECLVLQLELLPARHPQVGRTRSLLAGALLGVGDVDAARDEWVRAMEVFDAMPEDHPAGVRARLDHALFVVEHDGWAAGWPAVQGVERAVRGGVELSPLQGALLDYLMGVCLQAQGRAAEVAERIKAALAVIEQRFGAGHPRVVVLREILARLDGG